MKKTLLLFLAISMLLLVGCASNEEINTNISGDVTNQEIEDTVVAEPEVSSGEIEDEVKVEEVVPAFDVKEYEGDWISSEEVERDFDKEGGNGLTLKVQDDKTISFEYTLVSAAPQNRIAFIELENIELDENHTAAFSWEDSWLNKGNGTIKLESGKIILNITDIQADKMAMWGLKEGEIIFVKN